MLCLFLKGNRMLTEVRTELDDSAAASQLSVTDTKEGIALAEETERVQKDKEQTGKEDSTKNEPSAAFTGCLTIQPNRVLCGVNGFLSVCLFVCLAGCRHACLPVMNYNNNDMLLTCCCLFFVKEQEKLFIIFTHGLNNPTFTEVEFSSENEFAKRVPGSLENEYTISVTAPGKYL